MKILLVHNDYGAYSGEEAVVDKMARMLADSGHAVAQFRRSSAGLRDSLHGKLRAFCAGIYSPSGRRDLRRAILRERPDVVNVHNLFPFIGPAALRECRLARVPVIMTVHNYRLLCPTGLFMRRGRPCELCLQKGNEWKCIRHNCELSLPKSIAYATRNFLARTRRHYLDCVDRFVCLTEFQRRKLIQGGFPEDKIIVIPNSFDYPEQNDCSSVIGDYVAFSGRISREKGIDLILDVARRNPAIPFRLAGSVRDNDLILDLPPNVELVGHLDGSAYQRFVSNSRILLMASRCYEGFPISILEGAAFARPVIAPDHGGFPEIVAPEGRQAGNLFIPGDADDLERKLLRLWNDPEECRALGNQARSNLRDSYSSQIITRRWLDLFESL